MYNTKATPSRLLLLLGFLLAAVMLGSGCERSEPSELPGDPHAMHASVNRSKITVEFAAALDQTQQPIPELFTVAVNGVTAPIKTVTVKENTVDLQLRDTVGHDDQVQLSFVNTDTADTLLRTVEQVPINDFAGLGATNNTTNRLWYLLIPVMALIFLFMMFWTRTR